MKLSFPYKSRFFTLFSTGLSTSFLGLALGLFLSLSLTTVALAQHEGHMSDSSSMPETMSDMHSQHSPELHAQHVSEGLHGDAHHAMMPAENISVTNAYATALIPGQEVSAGYMTLTNSGDEDAVLVSFSSSAANMVHLHETTSANGMMSMAAVDELVIPAGTSLAMAPGGKHLMIMGVDKQAFAGETVDLQIHFASGEYLELSMDVKALGR